MWACSCCLRFKFSPEEIEQRYKSQQIDRMLEKDKHLFRRQVKLLLLGAGESGKSTFLKQMRIIHGQKFEPEIVKEFQQVIYLNIVKGMKVLVDARQKLEIQWENPKNLPYGQHVLRFENTMILDARTFQDYAPSVKRLWMDKSIKSAFERRREFQLVRKILCFNYLFILHLMSYFYSTVYDNDENIYIMGMHAKYSTQYIRMNH